MKLQLRCGGRVLVVSSLLTIIGLSITVLHDFRCSRSQRQGSWLLMSVEQQSAPPTLVVPDMKRLASSLGDRTVNIKIGVLSPESRKPDEIWVEFDPTVQQAVSETRLILPFTAAPAPQELAVFFLHSLSGCSSALTPSNGVKDMGSYRQDGVALCERLMSRQPAELWKRWDVVYPSAEGFRATFLESADACFKCQSIDMIKGVRRFPAIALPMVVSWFKHIDMLDIDAQGMDVALVLSVAQQISKVKHVKLECQVHSSYLYHHEFAGQHLTPNNCTTAVEFLQQHGFTCTQEINNCACDEWNLFCTRSQN